MQENHKIQATKEWIHNFIIHHNICPFAKRVLDHQEVRYYVERGENIELLILSFISKLKTEKISTFFLLYLTQFPDYSDFLDFYYTSEAILEDSDYDAEYQVVAFHPDYLFAGEDAKDPSHKTNRSPYPMIHVLRRDQVEKAIESYGDTDEISRKNIELLRKLV